MTYTKHFQLADDVITHLNSIVPTITDPFLTSRYIGFVSIAAVTVYELAIKDIFIEFGTKKHKVLGNFTYAYFDRINGRIKTKIIKDEYIKKFGAKYVNKYKININKIENDNLRDHGISVLSSYNNVVEWRNQFAHEGNFLTTVTYNEIVDSYEAGKKVIDCLADTMRR